LDNHVTFNTNLIIELDYKTRQISDLEKLCKVLTTNSASKSHIKMRFVTYMKKLKKITCSASHKKWVWKIQEKLFPAKILI